MQLTVKILPKKMKKIDEKRGKFLKRFVNIEFMCFACYDNAEIEKPVQKL